MGTKEEDWAHEGWQGVPGKQHRKEKVVLGGRASFRLLDATGAGQQLGTQMTLVMIMTQMITCHSQPSHHDTT